jgi:acylphosphatase
MGRRPLVCSCPVLMGVLVGRSCPGSGAMHDAGMDIEATDIVVTGHVQGVFYRAGMREQAERLGVTGWVRNEPDGSVRAHLEGSPEALSELLEWCAGGTPSAQVDDVSTKRAEVTGTRGFEAD